MLYRDDGSKMIEGEYHDGKQSGEWTMWYDNGQKKSVDHYKDGVQDGEHVGWYTNGKIAADRSVQGRQARGCLEAMGPPGFQELGRDLQGRQESLMTR